MICASGRAAALGENFTKSFSHTFQLIRKFLLQRHCKMRVCACVKVAKFLSLNFFFFSSASGWEQLHP